MSKIEQIEKMNLFELRDEANKLNIDTKGLKKHELTNIITEFYNNISTGSVELGIINENLSTNNQEYTNENNQVDFLNLDEILPEINTESEEIKITNSSQIETTQIVDINIDLLDNSPLNFFSKLNNSKFNELKQSIADLGLLNPIIVRPTSNGRYEILAGRNRVDACKELNITKIPSIIKNVDDDDAEEIISDTNVAQRDELKPLEIARAYEIKARQIGKRQGKKSSDGEKFNYLEKIGEEFKVSGATVGRYLRLNNLIPELKEKLTNDNITALTGFELGLLDQKTQKNFLEVVEKSSNPNELLKSKSVKLIKNAFKDNNELTGKEKAKLKREGKKAELQPLSKDEIKNIFKMAEDKKVVRISIAIPENASEELKDFVEGNINSDPDWFISVIEKMAKGLIKY